MNDDDNANDETKTHVNSAQAAATRTHIGVGPVAPTKRRRRWPYIALVLFVIALAVVIWQWPRKKIEPAPPVLDELEAAIAEADRLDPGWRWEELEAKRRVVPDAENSAVAVAEVVQLLGGTRDRPPDFSAVEATTRLTPAQRSDLSTWLQARPEALRRALTLVDFPHGRAPLEMKANPIAILLPHTDQIRTVIELLHGEAIRKAEEGEPTTLQEFTATVRVAQAIGDEPLYISQLVRSFMATRAIRVLERTLSRGETTEAALASAQRLLVEEERFPSQLIARRGERAILFLFHQRLNTGVIGRKDISELFSGMQPKVEWPENLLAGQPDLRTLWAQELRLTTQAVEIAKKPIAEQPAALQKVDMSQQIKSPFDEIELLGRNKLGEQFEGDARRQTYKRAAMVALAAEHYRLRHGRWPVEVKEIDADIAASLPNDPYDNSSMRLRRLEDGLVVYSIGPNGRDEGGDLTGGHVKSPDIGFRLWDSQRRK